MNKILNWTVGSFFRTIGRIVAYLGIGLLIAYLFSNSDINWGIKDLFFDKVNASSYDVKWINGAQWKVLGGSYATAAVDGGAFYSFTDSLSNNSKTYVMKFNNGPIVTPSNSKEYLFNVKLNMALPNGASIYNNQYTCTISSSLDVTNGAITDYSVGYPTSEYEDIEYWYKSFTCNASYGSIEMEEVKFAITMFYWVDNNESAHQPCYAQSNAGQNYSFVCPVSIGLPNINGVVVKIWSNATTNFTFGLNDLFNINLDSNQQIINNQQQQIQQQQQNHNETQSYLEDSNTTQAESEATEFFNDFQVEDHGGLSGIITAPLSTIQGLLNNTCTNLVLPLPFVNENLTLPCMSSIYTQHFGAFFSIYQTIILAIISYRCLRSLFYDVRGFINPDDDRIEVMDL